MSWFMATVYDRIMQRTERRTLRKWRGELLSGALGRVLEVGAGTGANLEFYPSQVQELCCIEPDDYMRKRLLDRLREADYRAGASAQAAQPNGAGAGPTREELFGAELNAADTVPSGYTTPSAEPAYQRAGSCFEAGPASRGPAQVAVYSADMLKLPFAAESFDAVVSTLVLCSVNNNRAALIEALRVLKPSGKFFFIEHVLAEPGAYRRYLQYALDPAWRCLAGNCRLTRDTEALIREVGFNICELHRARLEPAPAFIDTAIHGVAMKPPAA